MNLLIAALLVSLPQDTATQARKSVTDFLPEKASTFVEARNMGRVPLAVKAYLDRFAAEGKSGEALEKVVELIDMALQQLPEEARKKIKIRALGVRSAAVAIPEFLGFDDTPQTVFAIEFVNAKIVNTILTKDLDPWIGSTLTIGTTKIYRLDIEPALFLAAQGPIAVGSTDLQQVAEALKRTSEHSISRHVLLKELGKETSKDPYVRGFFDVSHMMSQSSLNDTRNDRWSFEQLDAATGWSWIRAVLFRASLTDGLITAKVETRLVEDVEVPVFELFKGAGGDAVAWKYVPGHLVAAASVRFESLKGFRDRLKTFLDRIDTVMKESGEEPQGFWDEFQEWLTDDVGVSLDEIVTAAGPEVLMFFARDLEEGGISSPEGFGIVLRVADRKKAEALLDTVIENTPLDAVESWEEKEHRGITIKYAETPEGEWAFAFTDDCFVATIGVKTLEAAIDAQKDGKGFLALGEHIPGLAEVMQPSSQTFALALSPVLELGGMVMGMMGGPGADFGADLFAEHAVDVAGIRTTANGLELTSAGCGGSALLYGIIPLSVTAIRGMSFGMAGEEEVEGTEPRVATTLNNRAEAYPLPEDPKEAEALIRRQVRNLNSDDAGERDEATATLLRIGRPAVAALAAEAKRTRDPETMARIKTLIGAVGAYEELPKVLQAKFNGLAEKIADKRVELLRWTLKDTGTKNLEPIVWDKRLKSEVILTSPAAIRKVADLYRSTGDDRVRRNAAALLALYDAGAVEDVILGALDTESDPKIARFLLIAAGWGRSEAAHKAVIGGLDSPELFTRRAAFLAVERSASPEVAGKLFELLGSDDPETRFNATFTLRRLTGAGLNVNAFLPKVERDWTIKQARKWWGSDGKKLKLRRALQGGLSMSMKLPWGYATSTDMVPVPVEEEPEESVEEDHDESDDPRH